MEVQSHRHRQFFLVFSEPFLNNETIVKRKKKTILSGHLKSIAVQFLLLRGAKRLIEGGCARWVHAQKHASAHSVQRNLPTRKTPLSLCEGERALAWFLKITPIQSSYVHALKAGFYMIAARIAKITEKSSALPAIKWKQSIKWGRQGGRTGIVFKRWESFSCFAPTPNPSTLVSSPRLDATEQRKSSQPPLPPPLYPLPFPNLRLPRKLEILLRRFFMWRGTLLYGKAVLIEVNPIVSFGSFLVGILPHGNGHKPCSYWFESRQIWSKYGPSSTW